MRMGIPFAFLATCFAFHGGATVLYVDASGTNPTPPFASWSTAATRIQDAVATASAGDTVLVTDGVYAAGAAVVYGLETNRVALTNALTLLSVNGPQATTIAGGAQIRGVYVGSNAVLSGFTVTNGHTRTTGDAIKEQSGGGIWCETSGVVSNCVAANNVAYQNGGGIYGGTLYNCVLTRNTSSVNGGGAGRSSLFNCTLSTNSAGYFGRGGGAWQCVLSNCIVQGNTATNSGAGFGGGTSQSINYSCTIEGNIAAGGGTDQGTNYNCTLTGNKGTSTAGGAYFSTSYNCALRQNTSSQNGGGAYGGTLYSCLLSNNSATTGSGGGAYSATVFNSLIVSNWAGNTGGGTYQCTLYNCTISGNSATNSGGGDFGGTLQNTILYYNSASSGSNWAAGASYVLCCTVPNYGGSTITNVPLFVNYPGGDFHLQSNSPCINSGRISPLITNTTDFDGNTRIVGTSVDIGAYEFQNPASILPYVWLWNYGFATDGSADYADADGDGMNNWQEWRSGTDPTNAASLLRILSVSNSVAGLTVQWQSVFDLFYSLQRSTNLSTQPAFVTIKSNITGDMVATSYTDSSATNSGPYFYRVGVK
jgi:hypothetical protein